MKKLIALCMIGLAAWAVSERAAAQNQAAPLKLANTVKMPAEVKGHFDHFGVDLAGGRLFSTAEGYKAVLVFDLKSGRLIHTISGIGIPHAVLYRQDLSRIYITDGGDGALRIYESKTYQLEKTVKLLVDADSIAYDPGTKYLYVVNGGGDAHQTYSTISVIDTTAGDKLADIKIDGDTLEAMAVESSSQRLYVNNRAKNQVEIVDRAKRTLVATWPVTKGKVNVAMAFDEPSHRLFVGCRSGQIVVFDTESGKEVAALPINTGVDDMVFDAAGKRLYAVCGAGGGSVDVYGQDDPDHYHLLGRVPTSPGAKTGRLVPELGKYFVAAPAQGATPAQALVYDVQ
ncbi:MAG TPA: YncE family protein [Terriglobia bacterium]|nr:YncE family protein [Terriglobia bacterium]